MERSFVRFIDFLIYFLICKGYLSIAMRPLKAYVSQTSKTKVEVTYKPSEDRKCLPLFLDSFHFPTFMLKVSVFLLFIFSSYAVKLKVVFLIFNLFFYHLLTLNRTMYGCFERSFRRFFDFFLYRKWRLHLRAKLQTKRSKVTRPITTTTSDWPSLGDWTMEKIIFMHGLLLL